MVYDQGLAHRIRHLIGGRQGLDEKKMFGGIGFLVQGNMACGVNLQDLIIRVGPEKYQDSLAKPYVKVFDLTGRPMTGWIVVQSPGYQADADLQQWVDQGLAFALSLPPK